MLLYGFLYASNLPVWPPEPVSQSQLLGAGLMGMVGSSAGPRVTSVPWVPRQLGGLSAAALSEQALPDSQQDLKESQMIEQMADD